MKSGTLVDEATDQRLLVFWLVLDDARALLALEPWELDLVCRVLVLVPWEAVSVRKVADREAMPESWRVAGVGCFCSAVSFTLRTGERRLGVLELGVICTGVGVYLLRSCELLLAARKPRWPTVEGARGSSSNLFELRRSAMVSLLRFSLTCDPLPGVTVGECA